MSITKKLPCIDCITLAICRATMKEYDEGLYTIFNKCELIRKYLQTNCLVGQPGEYEYVDKSEYQERKLQSKVVAYSFLEYIDPGGNKND